MYVYIYTCIGGVNRRMNTAPNTPRGAPNTPIHAGAVAGDAASSALVVAS